MIGSSGHAKVIIDIVEKEKKFQIVGILDRFRSPGEETLGYKILGSEDNLPDLISQYAIDGIIIAIGDNFTRSKVVYQVAELCPEIEFITTIHPRATIARDVSIGHGSVIMAGVTINSCCSIGKFCILNTHSTLDHDSTIEDFVSLAPHSATGGNCHIEKFSSICIGAILIHGIRVGEHSVIGAGATVLNDIAAYTISFGTPAKFIRERKPGEKYL